MVEGTNLTSLLEEPTTNEEPQKERSAERFVDIEFLENLTDSWGPKRALESIRTYDREMDSFALAEGEKRNGKIPVDYVLRLNDLVGPKLAVDAAITFAPGELDAMETTYDKFRFDTQPKTARGKLDRLLKFAEWKEAFRGVTSMSYYMENITESFSGFETLVGKIIASGDGGVMNYNPFIRDQLNDTAKDLLKHYGVKPTPENRRTGHEAREIHYEPKKVVPGITTWELVDFLIEKKVAGELPHYIHVRPGFDDARTALEVAVMGHESEEVEKYVLCGFTSSEQVQSISLEKLNKLEELFSYSSDGEPSRHFDKDFHRFVASKVNGDAKKVDRFISLAERGGKAYLAAFDGSLLQTERILNLPEEERPSPDSIGYAKKVLTIGPFDKAVATAREIDTDRTEIFGRRCETKEEFLAFKADYEATLEEFTVTTGLKPDEAARRFSYDSYKSFEGDKRFFSYSWSHQTEEIAKVEEAMTYESFARLNVSDKGELVSTLLEKGFEAGDIMVALTGEKTEGYWIKRNLRNLRGHLTLDVLAEICRDGSPDQHAIWTLQEIPFAKLDIPYGILDALKENNVTPPRFAEFIETVGIEQYRPEPNKPRQPKFDLVSFLSDYKAMYNLKPNGKPRKNNR